MKRTFAVLLWASAIAASAQANSIIYLGTDPSVHYPSFPQAVTLAGNAARYAGGNTNPKIAYVDDDPSFGGSVSGVLTSASLTQLTQFTPAGLAAANLSLFDVVYLGATASASSLAPAARMFRASSAVAVVWLRKQKFTTPLLGLGFLTPI
jgi:hypothetical protein